MSLKVLTISRLGFLITLGAITIISICFLIQKKGTPSALFIVDLEIGQMIMHAYKLDFGVVSKSRLKHINFIASKDEQMTPLISESKLELIFDSCFEGLLKKVPNFNRLKSVIYVGTSGQFNRECIGTKSCSRFVAIVKNLLQKVGYANTSIAVEVLTPEMRSFYGFLGINDQFKSFTKNSAVIAYVNYESEDLYLTSEVATDNANKKVGAYINVTFNSTKHTVLAQGVPCGGQKMARILYELSLISDGETDDDCLPKNHDILREPRSYFTSCTVDFDKSKIDVKSKSFLFKGTGRLEKCLQKIENMFGSDLMPCKNSNQCLFGKLTSIYDVNFTNAIVLISLQKNLWKNEIATVKDYKEFLDFTCYSNKTDSANDCFYYIYGYYILKKALKLPDNHVSFIKRKESEPDWVNGQTLIVKKLKSPHHKIRLIDQTVYLCFLIATTFFLTLFLVISVRDWLSGRYHLQHV